MQLKKTRSIRKKLALASSALLLTTPVLPVTASEEANATNVDNIGISRLYYQEVERVSVEKTQMLINKEINESNALKFSYVYDTISGASPNGRIYTSTANPNSQTITSASGNNNSAAANAGANTATWKTVFKDTRIAYNAEWEHTFYPGFISVLGAGTSTENDYDAKTFSGKFLFDTNQRRTTITGGASMSIDKVSPIGGVPEGGSTIICNQLAFTPTWIDCDAQKIISQPADKILTDFLIGVTQVWNKRTLMQFNFAYGIEDGYLTDPYKQVSVLSSAFGDGEVALLYEKRPRARNTKSLYYKVVHLPTNKTAMHFSYRFYWDDWNVRADTFDGRLRMNITPKIHVQTHARAHWQTEAMFFQPYTSTDPTSQYYALNGPNFISADSRLSALTTLTAGVKLGIKINSSSQVSFRVEKMTQAYADDLLPLMQTLISQINLSFRF